jgi:hypothetical protein
VGFACCRLQLGLTGAALAFTCSQATTAVLLILYAVIRDARMAAQKHEQATWCRPSLAIFAGGGFRGLGGGCISTVASWLQGAGGCSAGLLCAVLSAALGGARLQDAAVLSGSGGCA